MSLSTLTLTGSFTAVYLGVDVESWMEAAFSYFGLNASDYVSQAAGTVVVAYSLHKVGTPWPPRLLGFS